MRKSSAFIHISPVVLTLVACQAHEYSDTKSQSGADASRSTTGPSMSANDGGGGSSSSGGSSSGGGSSSSGGSSSGGGSGIAGKGASNAGGWDY